MTGHACNGRVEVDRHECVHCAVNDEAARLARREASDARRQAVFARGMLVVALRMLKRAGQLKPTTDDERAAIELAGWPVDLPAAERALIDPPVSLASRNEYVAAVIEAGQAVLFTDSCEDECGEAA